MGAPDQNGPEGRATGGSPATECGPATAESRRDSSIAISMAQGRVDLIVLY
jgi:hypothetical protein